MTKDFSRNLYQPVYSKAIAFEFGCVWRARDWYKGVMLAVCSATYKAGERNGMPIPVWQSVEKSFEA